ncbi:MAG: hypothetical protein Q4E57_07495 [Eubacteriales bacterium]|nr:hypothetical protein [Eubacteriales bacterium]
MICFRIAPMFKRFDDGNYFNAYLMSGGADSPREIRCRLTSSIGQWFLVEQLLLSGIRPPKKDNQWA